jgi:hypothetical protein
VIDFSPRLSYRRRGSQMGIKIQSLRIFTMKVHLKLLTAVLFLVPLNLMAASAPSAEGEKLNVC